MMVCYLEKYVWEFFSVGSLLADSYHSIVTYLHRQLMKNKGNLSALALREQEVLMSCCCCSVEMELLTVALF